MKAVIFTLSCVLVAHKGWQIILHLFTDRSGNSGPTSGHWLRKDVAAFGDDGIGED